MATTKSKKPATKQALRELDIGSIRVGHRHRQDMGDLAGLAESISRLGQLQPIGVTASLDLVFGLRRLIAQRDHLKRKTILARVVDVPSILAGEYAENEVRKDFTPSERVAIARAVEREIGNRRGERPNQGRVQLFAHVGQKTRDVAAERAGFGNHETYRQAAKVVESGTPKLIQAMDDGRVSISAAAILAGADADEQEAVLELDEKAILQAAREIRARQAEKRAARRAAKTPKPVARPSRERLRATRLIRGDCLKEMSKLPAGSVDVIPIDPVYPEIDREYGRMTEAAWHDLMRGVVAEGRRLLKPTGSMVVILQPNYERVGRMRPWLWEFVAWAAKEWNLVQDVYWWQHAALPVAGTDRKTGLLRASVKTCVWLGPADCYRNQENVLWTPSDDIFAERKEATARRMTPSGHSSRHASFAAAADERGGTTPFNLLPIAAGRNASDSHGHPAATPYEVAAWWVKYLLPPAGVLLDCFCGSGTMLAAGLDFGASQVIGIDREKMYLDIARKRIAGG